MAVQPASPPFLATLRASGLLDAAQIAALAKCPEARDASPTPLARAVLQRGWLTRFQINMLAAGRGKELIVGPYVLLDRLGEGGMGQVYKARHQHMNRLVALKVIRKEKLGSPEAVKRFYQEVQMAAALHHPNIVLAYDAGPAGSNHYFAMEYVEGIDLARLVKEQGRLPVPQACDYIRQAALGLQHAHERGLIHRDVKPANLLVSRAPAKTDVAASPTAAARGDVVKLLDMGLARLQAGGDTGVTRLGAVIGTPDYIAPEQALNSKTADVRADLYSLGCSLYYLLTGRPPFTGHELTEVLLQHQMEQAAPLSERGVQAPEGVQAILDTLMAKRPEDRYQTPAELIAVLTPFCREGTLAVTVFNSLRDSGRVEDDWASLTLDDPKEKDAGRSSPKPGTKELSRTSAGGRETRRKREEAGAGKQRSNRLLLGIAGVGVVLALLLTGVVVYLVLGRPAPEPVAQAPHPAETIKRGAPTSADEGKPPEQPPNGGGQPLPPLDGGKPVPPLDGGGKPPVTLARDEVRRFEGHTAQVRRLALSPDGRQVLTAGFDGTLRLWDVADGREVLKWGVGAGTKVHGVAFLPDGKRALSCCQDDKKVTLWDVKEGREIRSFAGPTGGVWQVAVSGDGRVAASCGAEDAVFLWDLDTGEEKRRLKVPGGVESVALSRDGKVVLTGGMQGELILWDAEKGEELRRFQAGHLGNVMGLALSADGKVALSAGTDEVVRLWKTEDGHEKRTFEGVTASVCSAALSADGGRALTGGVDGAITLWDAATGKVLRRFTGHTDQVCTLAFCPDGLHALSGSFDKTVRLWQLPPPPAAPPPADTPLIGPVAKPALPAGEFVAAAAFSPDGKRLVVGGRKLRLWDLGRDKELHDFGGTSYLTVQAVSWSADGRRVLMGGMPLGGGNTSGVAVLFEADTGKVVQTFTGHPTSVSAIALSPDGRHVLTGAGALKTADGKPVRGPDNRFVWEDTEVRRWEVATGKEQGRYRGPISPVLGLGFAADGKSFSAVGGIMDSAAFVWDVDKVDGRRVPLGRGAQHQAAVSADGREVACVGSDQAWHVYELKEGKEKCHSEKLTGFPIRLAWSRDGRYIVCGTVKPQKEPGTAPIYLADAATGKVVKSFEGHPNMVGALALSDDGRLVFSSSSDGARLWEREKAAAEPPPAVTPVPEKPLFVGHDGSVLAVAFSPDGKKLISGGKDKTVRVWDVATGEELKKLDGLFTAPSRVAFAAGGKQAVATSTGSGFVSWEIETGKVLQNPNFGQHHADALSADGEQVFLARTKNWVEVQKTGDSGGAARSVTGQWGTVVAAAFTPDGHTILLVGGDGLLHEANLKLEKEVGKGFPVSKGEVICLAVHPKATHIVTASDDKSVTLWKLPTVQAPAGQSYACKGHKDKVNCLAFAPDGKHFVTGGADATVRVWDLQGKGVAQSTEHKAAVHGVAFSPDGKKIVSCGDGIKLWEWQPKPPAKP